jgi:hypothetical protein
MELDCEINQFTNDGQNLHASRVAELKNLLHEIREEAIGFSEIFLSEEERGEMQDAIEAYDGKVQDLMLGTRVHLAIYKDYGWKELIYGERDE